MCDRRVVQVLAGRARLHEQRRGLINAVDDHEILKRCFPRCDATDADTDWRRIGHAPREGQDLNFILVFRIDRLAFDVPKLRRNVLRPCDPPARAVKTIPCSGAISFTRRVGRRTTSALLHPRGRAEIGCAHRRDSARPDAEVLLRAVFGLRARRIRRSYSELRRAPPAGQFPPIVHLHAVLFFAFASLFRSWTWESERPGAAPCCGALLIVSSHARER